MIKKVFLIVSMLALTNVVFGNQQLSMRISNTSLSEGDKTNVTLQMYYDFGSFTSPYGVTAFDVSFSVVGATIENPTYASPVTNIENQGNTTILKGNVVRFNVISDYSRPNMLFGDTDITTKKWIDVATLDVTPTVNAGSTVTFTNLKLNSEDNSWMDADGTYYDSGLAVIDVVRLNVIGNKAPVILSSSQVPTATTAVQEGNVTSFTITTKDVDEDNANGVETIKWYYGYEDLTGITGLTEVTTGILNNPAIPTIGDTEITSTLTLIPHNNIQKHDNNNLLKIKAVVKDKKGAITEQLFSVNVQDKNTQPNMGTETAVTVAPIEAYKGTELTATLSGKIITDAITGNKYLATDADDEDKDSLVYYLQWANGTTLQDSPIDITVVVETAILDATGNTVSIALNNKYIATEKGTNIFAHIWVEDNSTEANKKSIVVKNTTAITVANSAPVIGNPGVTQSTSQNTAITALNADLIAGSTDIDSDALKAAAPVVRSVTNTITGLSIATTDATASVNAAGDIVLTPKANFKTLPVNSSATVVVSYKVTDGSAQSLSTADMTTTITGENDAPTRDGGASVIPVISDSAGSHIEDVTTAKDISVPTVVTGLFSDVDHGDTVTLSYQWQISKSGSNSYSNITQTSGATATLTFTDRDTARDGADDYKVRCIISAKDGQDAPAVNSITSSDVTVGPQTLIGVIAQNSVNENETATFTATVTPSTGKTVASAEWEFSVNGNDWITFDDNIAVETTNTTDNTVSTFTFTPNYLVSTKTSAIDYDVRLKTIVGGSTIYSSTHNIAVVNVERDPVFNENIIVNPPLVTDKADLPANITVSVASGDVATDPDADGSVEITYAWFIKKDGKKYNYNAINGATSAVLFQATLKDEIEGLGKNLDVCQVKCVITATCGDKSANKEFIVQVGLYEYTKFVIPYGYYGPIELTNLPGSEKPGVGGNQEVWIDGNIFNGKVVNKATFVKEDTKSFAIDITKKLQHYAPGEYIEAIKARKFTMKSASLISPADAGRIYVKSNKVTFEPALDFNTDGAAPVKFDYSIEVEVNGRLYLYTFIGYIKVLPVNDKPVITWSQEQNTAEKGISPIIVATVTPGAANESAQTLTVDTPVIKPTNGFTISPVTDGENGAKIVRFTPTSAGVATALTISVKDDAKNAAADASYYAKVKHTDKPAAVKASIKVISGVANENPSFVLINDGKVTAEETAKTAGKAIAGSKLAFANTVKAWTTDAAAGIEAKQKLKFTVVVAPADKAKFTKVPTVALDAKSATANMSFTVAPNLLGEIATVTVIATDSGVPAATFAQDVKIFIKALAPTIPTFDISALDAFDEQISTSMVSEIKKFNAGLNIKGTVKSTEIKWFKNVEESEFATGETVTAPDDLNAGDKITVKVTMTPTATSEAAVEWAKSFFVGNPEWFPAVNLSSLKNSVDAGSYQVTMVQGKVTAKVITTVEDARSFIKVNEYIAAKSKGFQPNQEVRITLINKWDEKAFKTPVFKEDLKAAPAQTLTFLTTQYGMPDLDTTFEGNVSFDNTVLSCPIDVIDAQGFTYEIWSGIEKSKLKKLLNGTINFSDTMDKYLDDDKNVTTLCSYVLNYNIPTTGFYQVRVKAFNPRYMPKTLIFGDAEEATEITPVAAPTFGTIENIEFFPAIGKIGVISEDPKSKYTARFSWPVIDGAEGYVLYYKIGSGGKEVKKDMKKLNYFERPTTVATDITWKVIPQYKPDGKKLVENIAGAKTGLIFAIVSDNVVEPAAPAAITANTIKTVYNPTNNTITLEAIDLAENETWNFYIYNLNETVMEVFENQPAKVTIENVQPDEYIIMGSRSVGDETGEWSDEILVK